MDDTLRKWVASSLLNGHTPEQLRPLLIKSGFSVEAVENELAIAVPYIAATEKLRKEVNKLYRREALLKTLDYQMRALPHYLKPEKVPLPPFKDFLQEYYYPNRLGFFSGVLDKCEAKHWTPRRLIDKVGAETTVEIQYGVETYSTERNLEKYKKKIKFGDFITMVEDPNAGNKFYMKGANYDHNHALFADLRKEIGNIGDGYMVPEHPNRRMIFFIGPKGTVLSSHYDLSNNMFIQVYGRKMFRIVPALQVPYMYNEIENFSDVDILNPDLKLYPDFANATVIEIEIGPGEALFLPKGWWHHVTSLSPSISLACTNIKTLEGYEDIFIDRKKAFSF